MHPAQLRVDAVQCHELVVRAGLADCAVGDDVDTVDYASSFGSVAHQHSLNTPTPVRPNNDCIILFHDDRKPCRHVTNIHVLCTLTTISSNYQYVIILNHIYSYYIIYIYFIFYETLFIRNTVNNDSITNNQLKCS